jgi:hypothetical protein
VCEDRVGNKPNVCVILCRSELLGMCEFESVCSLSHTQRGGAACSQMESVRAWRVRSVSAWGVGHVVRMSVAHVVTTINTII